MKEMNLATRVERGRERKGEEKTSGSIEQKSKKDMV